MSARDESDSSVSVVVMGPTVSERSSGPRARLWTTIGHWRDGKKQRFPLSDVGAHMARLGVETTGRAFSSIKNTMFAKYSERYSLRRPWEHVGPSARRRPSWTVAAVDVYISLGGKGLKFLSVTSR